MSADRRGGRRRDSALGPRTARAITLLASLGTVAVIALKVVPF